ncbi:hypothetical protein [Synechococcus sp. 1G10]
MCSSCEALRWPKRTFCLSKSSRDGRS